MLRVLIISLLLLSLPFLVYVAYFKVTRSGSEEGFMWRDAPVIWLAVAGVAVAVAGLIGLMQLTGMD